MYLFDFNLLNKQKCLKSLVYVRLMQNQGLGHSKKICAKNTPKIYLANLPIIGQNMLEKCPYLAFIVRVGGHFSSL